MIDLGVLAPVRAYETAVQRAIEHPEVDALIVIFAGVGRCDPRVVGRAIRRGVLRGERRSGVSKPVLLCLMGAAGALRFGTGRGARGHVFPSYRFPESAAMALSLAVQYAAFRRQPPGRLPWYGDADAAAARREVAAALAADARDAAGGGGDGGAGGNGGETIWLEDEAARRILGCFGIPAAGGAEALPGPAATVAADDATAAASDSLGARLEVRSDPSFGPLLHLLPAGKPPLVRITPLTDRDIRELMAAAGLPADGGIEELLGRVSQLVEELPWLSRMTAEIRCAREPAGAWRLSLAPGARLGLAAPVRG